MIRLLLAALALVLIVVMALAALWLLGEFFAGIGGVLVAAASLLLGVLRFMLVAGLIAGLAYILSSAWSRP